MSDNNEGTKLTREALEAFGIFDPKPREVGGVEQAKAELAEEESADATPSSKGGQGFYDEHGRPKFDL